MADQIVSGDSPEAVAYALFLSIALQEDKLQSWGSLTIPKADEKWVLDTYAKCLKAVESKSLEPQNRNEPLQITPITRPSTGRSMDPSNRD